MNERKYAQVLVDLSAFAVFPQQTAENPLPPHPLNFGRHPSLRSTLPLTHTCMPPLPLGSEEIASTSPGMNDGGLDNDSSILDELLDVGTRVCVANFWLFIGVEPDLALADVGDGGGEPLLRTEVDHGSQRFGGGQAVFGYWEGAVAEFERCCTTARRVPMSRGPDRVSRRLPGRINKINNFPERNNGWAISHRHSRI